MVPMQADGVWGEISIMLCTDLPKPWGAVCGLSNLATDTPRFGCMVYEDNSDTYNFPVIPVQFGQWYTVRMEMDPATGAIQTYLDGILVGHYLAKNASTLQYSFIKSFIFIWTYDHTPLMAEIDNVRITGGAVP